MNRCLSRRKLFAESRRAFRSESRRSTRRVLRGSASGEGSPSTLPVRAVAEQVHSICEARIGGVVPLHIMVNRPTRRSQSNRESLLVCNGRGVERVERAGCAGELTTMPGEGTADEEMSDEGMDESQTEAVVDMKDLMGDVLLDSSTVETSRGNRTAEVSARLTSVGRNSFSKRVTPSCKFTQFDVSALFAVARSCVSRCLEGVPSYGCLAIIGPCAHRRGGALDRRPTRRCGAPDLQKSALPMSRDEHACAGTEAAPRVGTGRFSRAQRTLLELRVPGTLADRFITFSTTGRNVALGFMDSTANMCRIPASRAARGAGSTAPEPARFARVPYFVTVANAICATAGIASLSLRASLWILSQPGLGSRCRRVPGERARTF